MDQPNPESCKEVPLRGNLAAGAFVHKCLLFKKVPEEDLEPMLDAACVRKFGQGASILCEGDEGKDVFLIMEGAVEVITLGPAGPFELAHLSRGAFFGEVGVLTGQKRTATIVALSDVELVVLPHTALEEILKRHPKVRKLMQTVMEARVRDTIEKAKAQEGA